MTKPDDVLYTHEPREGLYVVGVPARDLTRADAERMSPRRLQEALATGLYRKAEREETEAEKTAKASAKAGKAAQENER